MVFYSCKWYYESVQFSPYRPFIALNLYTVSVPILGLSLMTLIITTFSLTTLLIKGLYVALSIRDTQHK
jgi:hypothetical protein